LIKYTMQAPDTLKQGFDATSYIVSPKLYEVQSTRIPPVNNSLSPTTNPNNPNANITNIEQNKQEEPLAGVQDLPETFLNTHNFMLILDLLSLFARNIDSTIVVKTMNHLSSIVNMVPGILLPDIGGSSPSKYNNQLLAWDNEAEKKLVDYWVTIFMQLSFLCRDNRADIRNQSLNILQRSLLSQALNLVGPDSWVLCFDKVIFPLLDELLLPLGEENGQSKDIIEETRLRGQQILVKTFLQYMSVLIKCPNFNALWLKILSYIQKYMTADKSQFLAEAVTESLKNILLVMFANDILKPAGEIPSDLSDPNLQTQLAFWDLSWRTIDEFCPQMKSDFIAKLINKTNPTDN